ncbi:hypothetical protein AB0B39_12545 [Micromonospora sp. NPDC049114]|uniref:hypothetical protein n=1 Tax=Micromonospora sp. NPDC049114 TaxID=3155498 RepID=UPI0033E4B9A2
MTSPTPPRRRARPLLVAGFGVVGLLACLWGLWFASLRAFGNEGSLPPKWRIPDVPAGATVVDESEDCASGGCSWQVTVTPAAGQSPEDLAEQMGLSEDRTEPPKLFDPGSVYVVAQPRNGQLVIHVGYE